MGFSSDNSLQANQLPISMEIPPVPEQLPDVISILYKRVAASVNTKQGGLYNLTETATFQQFFAATGDNNLNFRPTYRTVYSFGPVARGTDLPINTNIASFTQFTHIYGTCITDLPDYRPIPYASTAANSNIDVRVTTNPGSQIIVAVGAGSPNIVSGIIVLEYLKT